MSKTAEETILSVYTDWLIAENTPPSIIEEDVERYKESITPLDIEAMHTYAEQRAVEFAEWCDASQYNYFGKGTWLGFDNVQYTTSDLYQLFTQQNQK